MKTFTRNKFLFSLFARPYDMVISLRRAGYSATVEAEGQLEYLVTDASLSECHMSYGNAGWLSPSALKAKMQPVV